MTATCISSPYVFHLPMHIVADNDCYLVQLPIHVVAENDCYFNFSPFLLVSACTFVSLLHLLGNLL